MGATAGTFGATVSVHHDGLELPAGPPAGGAWLWGDQSHATISNSRGEVHLILHGGTCGSPTSPYQEDAAGHVITAGPFKGTFDVATDPGTTSGSFAGAGGSGTYVVTAGVAPGAANSWQVVLDGSIRIPEPTLTAVVGSVFWGSLGLDFASRIVSVSYTVTNAGPGDAYGVELTGATSPAVGVTPLGPSPVVLGDLLQGQSTTVVQRFQLGVTSPCGFVVLGCSFPTALAAVAPDALDSPISVSIPLTVTAPIVPLLP
jgi:hypothetical protein